MTESMRLHDQAQQVRRIAHLLGSKPEDLDELLHVPADELRELHDQLAEWLFAVHADSFARVAAVSKVLPGALAGKMAERFLEPPLAARAAVMLEPAKAVDLVTKVSVRYLGDVAMSLDPVRGKPVIRAIPPARVAEVAAELFRRDELAAMAEFAGTVDKPALDAALKVATPAQLVRVAPLLVWNDNIEEIIDELSDERLDAILTAVADDDLWLEASVLLRRLRVETLERVVHRLAVLPEVAAQIPTDLVGELAVDLFETGEYASMVMFVPVVPDAALERALDVAGGANLLRIAPLLEWTDRVHDIVDRLTDEQLDTVLGAMAAEDLWSEASVLLRQVRPSTLTRVAKRLEADSALAHQIPSDLIRDLATDLFATGDLATMVVFVPVISAEALTAAIDVAGGANLLRIAPLIEWTDRVHDIVDRLTDEQLDTVLGAMAAEDLWSEASVLLRQVRPSTLTRVAKRLEADSALAHQIPSDLIRDLATDLFATGDLATMVLFVPVISAAALTAAIDVAGAANLLRIAPLVEWTETVVAVLEELPDSFLDDVLGQVVEQDLFSEGEALVEQLDAGLRARVVARLSAAPPELLARIREVVLSSTSSPVLRDMLAAVKAATP